MFPLGRFHLHALVGCAIVDDVMLGKAEWSALFVKHDFFQRYRFYLQVVASSRNLDMQNKWCVGERQFQVNTMLNTRGLGPAPWRPRYDNW